MNPARFTKRWTLNVRRAFILAAIVVALLSSSAPAKADIKIGLIVPLTGDLGAFGEGMVNGARLAIEEINAEGGVLGQALRLAIGDTQTKPQAGVDTAQKLVAIEGVSVLLGAQSSGVTIPVALSVSKVQKVLQISAASTSPTITTLDDGDFLFRTVPSDLYQGLALAEVVHETGYRNLAILYVNNDYGDGLARSFEQAFAALGGATSVALAYEPGNPSYRGELAAAARGGGEALLLIGYPEYGITILRQALEEGYFQKFVFPDGMKSPVIIEQIGHYLEGAIGTNPAPLAEAAPVQHFRRSYEERYGEPPAAPFIDGVYDALYLVALAMERAKSADRVAIRDALRAVAGPPGIKVRPGEWAEAKALIAEGREVDYVGAAGDHDFDAAGDVAGTFAFWRIEDGAFVTIKVFKPGGEGVSP